MAVTPHVTFRDVGQLERVFRSEICERVHFEMRPRGFDGVELGCVGWKQLHSKMTRPAKHPNDGPAAMHIKPVHTKMIGR
jgi:hypothetical protein